MAGSALRCILATVLVLVSTKTHAAAVDSSKDTPICFVRSDRAPQRDELLPGAIFLESEHFVVSYHTSGPDSIYHPDLVPTLLEDLEYAHRVLSTDPRCAMRAPYGTYGATDGRRKLEVFIETLVPPASGRAHAIWPSQAPDAPCASSADGYFRISRELRTRQNMRHTGTHELMHVFQFTMNVSLISWAYESTARWAEGFVNPQDHFIQRSRPSLLYHATALWDESHRSKLYSPHFWNFLDQTLGASIPPKVWARACDMEWMEALRATLAEYSVTFDQKLHEYAVWNYYTGTRDDGVHYPLPGLSEIRPEERLTSYPVVAHDLGDACAEEAGSNYIFFMGTASRANLRVQLHGSRAWLENRMVSWIGTTGSNTHHEVSVDLAREEFAVPQWHQYDQVAVIVTNGAFESPIHPKELRYTVAAIEEGNAVADLVWGNSRALLRSTNPAKGGAAIRYQSTGAVHPTQVVVYDARGRLVRSLVDRAIPAGNYGVYWDGNSQTGDRAAAGAYMLVLKHDGGTVPRRFILLH